MPNFVPTIQHQLQRRFMYLRETRRYAKDLMCGNTIAPVLVFLHMIEQKMRVWGCAASCSCGKQWSIFPFNPAAYVWFIYIHGYPDNEAFNPGDPVVRTMNPITSCCLWDGMADSETDGRGCTRPAIQSHSSRLLPVSPVHVFCSNLSTGRGENLGSLHHTHQQFCKRRRTNTFPTVHSTPAIPSPPLPSRPPLLTCTSCLSLNSNTMPHLDL